MSKKSLKDYSEKQRTAYLVIGTVQVLATVAMLVLDLYVKGTERN